MEADRTSLHPVAPAAPAIAWGLDVAAVRERVRRLHPAYFALVMSTGIVSVALKLLGFDLLTRPLLWLNVASYALLCALTLLRAWLFTDDMVKDLRDHQRSVGFFTTVAATAVVGVQLVVIEGDTHAAMYFWWAAVVLWLVCTYTVFTALIVKEDKPSLADGIHGGWLLSVVATQAVCVLGCQVAHVVDPGGERMPYALVALWLCGGMLYIWTISLIFYRYLFFRFLPSDLMPPYWINMGAMAISTLAGALLVKGSATSPFLHGMLPFLKGFTLLYWATATWWIPMLVILGIWRHGLKKLPVTYDAAYWGAVFPLAMYTACTLRLSDALELDFLRSIPRVFMWIALVAWTLAFAGLVKRVSSLVVRRAA